jgi:hypothetical protein
MKYQVFFTDVAFAEAVQHVEFLMRVSAEAAKQLSMDFSHLESTLCENPFLWPVVPFPGKREYRSLVLQERYLVIFIIDNDIVYVETIIDARSQFSWLLG